MKLDKTKKIIFSKTLFFFVTTGIILLLNLTPLLLQFLHTPSGRTFALIHNNAQDFFFYQSLMNKGAHGNWLTSDPYTTEPHQPSIIFSYFLWLGKISKALGLPYAVTYHLIRIVLAFFFLFLAFYFLFFLRLPYPRLTYFFFLFAAPFLHNINDYGKITTVPFMHWWTGMDPIRRAAYLPHHLAGGLIFVFSLLLLIKEINLKLNTQNSKKPLRQKYHYLLWAIALTPLLAFIHTPSLLILLLILPPTVIFYLLLHGKLSLFAKFISLLLYWIVGLFFLLLMILQTQKGFPWSQYIDWEKNLQFPLEKELIGALGILFPFSILGAWQAIKSKKFEYLLIVCWLFVPFFLIPFAPKIGLSNIRLIQGVPYLPLAILATLGLAKLNLFKNPLFQKKKNLILLAVLIIFSIFTYPTLKWSLQDQIREYWPIFGNVYFDNRLNQGFSFINQNFPKKTVVLATFYTGNYLPAFTDTISFIGHSGYTYNLAEKEKNVRKFFEGKMTDKEAKEFILNNKITLIWQGPEEKLIYNGYLYPNFLKVIYDQEELTLYLPRNSQEE